jgi:hypothetical protein
LGWNTENNKCYSYNEVVCLSLGDAKYSFIDKQSYDRPKKHVLLTYLEYPLTRRYERRLRMTLCVFSELQLRRAGHFSQSVSVKTQDAQTLIHELESQSRIVARRDVAI